MATPTPMRLKILLSVLAGVLLGVASFAYAAAVPPQLTGAGWTCEDGSIRGEINCRNSDGRTASCITSDTGRAQASCTINNTDRSQTTRGTTGETQYEKTSAPPPGDGNTLQGIFSVILQVVVIILYLTLFLSNFLLWLAGMLFNTAFVETVLQFGQNFGNTSGILSAWTVLRDLGNIFLLFSFVFMGLATILNLHDYTVKKTLPRLIIFAVLLNFSLFAAEAVVDVSNGLSAAIVGQTIPNEACTESGTALQTAGETAAFWNESAAEACTRSYGITGLIMDNSHFSAVLDVPQYQRDWTNLDQTLTQLATLFGLSIFSSLLSVVFFAAAIMLVIRVIVLTFVIVTAPIGFAGMAVPFMGGIAKRWWHELVNQSLFVPVFVLLVFVGLKIIEGSGLGKTGGANIADAIGTGSLVAFDTIMTFAVAAGFFLAALMIAKRFGAMGADFAIEKAGSLTYGTMGMFGRQSVGRLSYHTARLARSVPLIGRGLGTMLDYGAESTFDFRATPLSKAATGIAGVGLGSVSGAGGHGFEGVVKEQMEQRLKHAELLEEEEERRVDKRKNVYERWNEEYDAAGGDAARARGDKKAQDLFDKRDAAYKALQKTHEGSLYLLEKEQDALKKILLALQAQATAAKGRAQTLRRQARTADPLARPGLIAQAAEEERNARAAEAQANTMNDRMKAMGEEMEDLTKHIRDEKLARSRQMLKSSHWNRLIPGISAPEAEALASVELRRLAGRDTTTKQVEKIIGAISKAGAKIGSGGGGGGGHGGGGGGGGAFVATSEAGHGEH